MSSRSVMVLNTSGEFALTNLTFSDATLPDLIKAVNLDEIKTSFMANFISETEPTLRVAYLIVLSIATGLGNLLVLVAVLKFPSLRRATNAMLGSLALSDFLVGTVTVPLYTVWTMRPGIFDRSSFMCALVLMSCLVVVTASQASLLLLSVEQYLAVCHPFKHRELLLSCPRLHALGVGLAWTTSLSTAAFFLLAYNKERNIACNYYSVFDETFLFVASIFGVFFPFALIIFFNVRVLCEVKESEKRITFAVRGDDQCPILKGRNRGDHGSFSISSSRTETSSSDQIHKLGTSRGGHHKLEVCTSAAYDPPFIDGSTQVIVNDQYKHNETLYLKNNHQSEAFKGQRKFDSEMSQAESCVFDSGSDFCRLSLKNNAYHQKRKARSTEDMLSPHIDTETLSAISKYKKHPFVTKSAFGLNLDKTTMSDENANENRVSNVISCLQFQEQKRHIRNDCSSYGKLRVLKKCCADYNKNCRCGAILSECCSIPNPTGRRHSDSKLTALQCKISYQEDVFGEIGLRSANEDISGLETSNSFEGSHCGMGGKSPCKISTSSKSDHALNKVKNDNSSTSKLNKSAHFKSSNSQHCCGPACNETNLCSKLSYCKCGGLHVLPDRWNTVSGLPYFSTLNGTSCCRCIPPISQTISSSPSSTILNTFERYQPCSSVVEDKIPLIYEEKNISGEDDERRTRVKTDYNIPYSQSLFTLSETGMQNALKRFQFNTIKSGPSSTNVVFDKSFNLHVLRVIKGQIPDKCTSEFHLPLVHNPSYKISNSKQFVQCHDQRCLFKKWQKFTDDEDVCFSFNKIADKSCGKLNQIQPWPTDEDFKQLHCYVGRKDLPNKGKDDYSDGSMITTQKNETETIDITNAKDVPIELPTFVYNNDTELSVDSGISVNIPSTNEHDGLEMKISDDDDSLRIKREVSDQDGEERKNRQTSRAGRITPRSIFSKRHRGNRRSRSLSVCSVGVSHKVRWMVALVCATFILAWFPFFAVILANVLCDSCALTYFLNAAIMVAFSKSMANPIVYALCHVTFRRAYSKVFQAIGFGQCC